MRALEHQDPRTIGRYRILARIGAGGMAIIYFGRSPGGRSTAVKVMHPEFAVDPRFRSRFRREVAATRAAGGPFSPAVLDADPDAATPWMATEFLPSVPLREAVRSSGPLPTAAAHRLAAGVAEALAHIHRAGVLHLDVTPANVLLTADGPRLIDFGIAGAVTGVGAPQERAGSRGFMSPEQIAGGPLSPASDVFSYGATLAYACTGAAAPPAGIPDDRLRTLIVSCMSPDPAARPRPTELVRRLAATPGSGSPTDLWWPPSVTAEIDQRAGEAENPPIAAAPEARRSPVRRRALLVALAAATGVGSGAGMLGWVLQGGRPEPRSAAKQTPGASSSPAGEPIELEFHLKGDVTLTWLRYTVDGDATTLERVKLPWRKTLLVPASTQGSGWRLDYRFPPGEVTYRVLVNGFQIASGGRSDTAEPVRAHVKGTI